MSQQEKYREEYEKYKHVKIFPGIYLFSTDSFREQIEVLSVDEEKEEVVLRTVRTGVVKKKTLHWCRKRLQKEQ